jgi:phenylacetate-CoA ligase
MTTVEQDFITRLQRTQWLSAEDLAQYQRPLIERLVRHAATRTEFYAERLAPLFHGRDPETAPIDRARWAAVPVIARAQAIHHVEQMKARDVPADTGALRYGESSGSTGRKLPHARSEIADAITSCLWDRVYELFELDLHARFAAITFDRGGNFSFPHGAKMKGWNHTDPEAEVHMLNLTATPAEQLDWLARVQPAHVMAYPINLGEVAELALAEHSPVRFRTFVSTGEVLDPHMQEIIERAFGCRVIDVYSVREIGQVAFPCPDAPGYHLCAEAVLCELLDEQGLPVRPGEFGRVVVTALYNYAMPFIRYEIGDYAQSSASPCPCGRGLPSIARIGGRTRNMIVMPDGSKKRLPRVVFHQAPRFLSYRQIQIVQHTVDAFEIRYLPDLPGDPDIEGLTRLFREEFHPGATVRLVPVERIERGAGMKIEEFVSRVPA